MRANETDNGTVAPMRDRVGEGARSLALVEDEIGVEAVVEAVAQDQLDALRFQSGTLGDLHYAAGRLFEADGETMLRTASNTQATIEWIQRGMGSAGDRHVEEDRRDRAIAMIVGTNPFEPFIGGTETPSFIETDGAAIVGRLGRLRRVRQGMGRRSLELVLAVISRDRSPRQIAMERGWRLDFTTGRIVEAFDDLVAAYCNADPDFADAAARYRDRQAVAPMADPKLEVLRVLRAARGDMRPAEIEALLPAFSPDQIRRALLALLAQKRAENPARGQWVVSAQGSRGFL